MEKRNFKSKSQHIQNLFCNKKLKTSHNNNNNNNNNFNEDEYMKDYMQKNQQKNQLMLTQYKNLFEINKNLVKKIKSMEFEKKENLGEIKKLREFITKNNFLLSKDDYTYFYYKNSYLKNPFSINKRDRIIWSNTHNNWIETLQIKLDE